MYASLKIRIHKNIFLFLLKQIFFIAPITQSYTVCNRKGYLVLQYDINKTKKVGAQKNFK